MKLKDLLFEVRIFQNNFIKVDMIKDELKMIFNNTDVPEISFDADGMYIAMDNFKLREFDNYGGFKKFSILSNNNNESNNNNLYHFKCSQPEKTIDW